ncbi:MAG: PolC-type DNA polymerase III [Eubacterium sp.]|nr:PolC-type DNA polymerase III [Eubacterium sp.]
MDKNFFEVFPVLQVNGEMRQLLADTQVQRVVSNRERTRLRIYLHGTRLIPKKQIFQLERSIKSQLFPGQELTVKIMEHYQLSAQYTPQTLMDIYKDSILEELKVYSLLIYNLFRCARMEFDGAGNMKLYLEDSIVARNRSDELLEVLYKIMRDRCGMMLTIDAVFEPKKENRLKKESDQQIACEIRRILGGVHRLEKTAGMGYANASGMGSAPEASRAGNVEKAGDKKAGAAEKDSARTAANGRFAGRTGGRRDYPLRRSDNPDVIYGRDFDDHAVPIDQIEGEMGEIAIRGQVLAVDTRELRNGEKSIVIVTLTDFTDSIVIKIFTKNEHLKELLGEVKKGAFLKIKGVTAFDRFDSELTLGSVAGIKKIPDFTERRMDTSPQKRVELHCHTKMSDMDGISDVGDIIKQAVSWGHKALAITDHGAIQAFPIANHAVPDGADFKIIYGVEAYLVDDLKQIVFAPKGQSLSDSYVVFDLETTGLSPNVHKIIEIGAVKVSDGKIVDRFSQFVNPLVPLPFAIEELTKIRDDMLVGEPEIAQVLPEFMEFCKGCVMVAHNAEFDMGFIQKNCEDLGLDCAFTVVDTVSMARYLLPGLNRFKLDTVAKELHISLKNHHRAVEDAECTAEIFLKFIQMLSERGIDDLDALNAQGKATAGQIMKMPTYHAILLATNDYGRVNLYRLVSMSHLTYFHKRPRIPKSELLRHREGLLLGSACEAGELYQAILLGRPQTEIARIVNFYDYLEIQPNGNNAFMIREERYPVSSEEDLWEINKKIVQLGEDFKKPVVATCDVHFLNPEDAEYRRIIMAGHGFKDADEQAPLFLHTTEEMLKEFAYLGSEKAEEVVITNPNLICDMCEKISPVRPDKAPPVIENSDQMLRDICYNKAHEMYGDNLPEIVHKRLERELTSIISNGYAVMYIIAQKLVWKSVEDGYLVGSRGSVGSSFVATMAGITEVNPLSPHYYCEYCHFSDFDSEEVKSYSGRSGCDMPDRVCPKCGKPLVKAGFDIPFETFLGFKGNKEPDIDLNFSGDYQSKAHKYTEVIFGAGQTFRAGTIGTLADKTAFGYVKRYYEERSVHKRFCEINRIVQGCVGIRRTTGQHPGGIVVLPMGEEIYSFTPIQHPANDMGTDIITTHFEYHSIDHNLLKLDILGHDDPTMIRMLEDLTGIHATQIPLDDPAVMSIFKSTDALGITPDQIGGCTVGSLGIPEFGTEFVIQMLIDTKPQSFSDLVRISGLSHGTDVWLGNAQTLIEEGKATISTAICTRDDIMIYLIGMGLESELSFTIMESVRKGKGLKEDWIKAMKEHGVPDWYIWSCQKIKYMFPKAHAAAYVMMAWRIAYCKVFYPLAYYAAYFSIRATSFNYELMCQGREKLEHFMRDYEKRRDTLTKKELDTIKDMKIVQEMYARGFQFTPIDLNIVKARHFQIIDGKLMPALSAIDGLGEKAADGVVEAVKDGPFLSKDDFRQRSKVSKSVADLMGDLGILGGIPESNQMSIFDFA